MKKTKWLGIGALALLVGSCGVNIESRFPNVREASEPTIMVNEAIDVGHEKLRVEDSKLVDSDGNQFLIHGINIGDSSDTGGPDFRKYTKTTYRLLKDEGFNTVRYTFGASLFYDLANGKLRTENFEALDQLMETATAVGMYVILDLHILRDAEFSFYSRSDDYCLIGAAANDEAAQKAAKYKTAILSVWREVAERVQGEPCVLAYSLLNEPWGGIDASKITYTSWEDYLAAGHTGSDWDRYVEERDAAITELQKDAVRATRGDYTSFIQSLIDEIRAIDPDTTVTFQPLASLCDVSSNYKQGGFDEYGWTEEERWPDVQADNLMIDSRHIYDNSIYEYAYDEDMIDTGLAQSNGGVIEEGTPIGVLNMSPVSDELTTAQWFSTDHTVTSNGVTVTTSDFLDGSNRVTGAAGERTATAAISATDTSFSFGWGSLYITNNGDKDATVTMTKITVYKLIDGQKVAVFSASPDDDGTKLLAYDFKEIEHETGDPGEDYFFNKPFSVPAGGVGNSNGSPIQKMKLGVKKGETIHLEFGIDVESDSSDIDLSLSFQANQYLAQENEEGQDLVTGAALVRKTFEDAKRISDSFGSPLYFGEFCVMSQCICDYTNFDGYTDEFARLTEEYEAGWIWHTMSENTQFTKNINGYGAYIGTDIPYPEYKGTCWDFTLKDGTTYEVIPTLLSTPCEIVSETPDPGASSEPTESSEIIPSSASQTSSEEASETSDSPSSEPTGERTDTGSDNAILWAILSGLGGIALGTGVTAVIFMAKRKRRGN